MSAATGVLALHLAVIAFNIVGLIVIPVGGALGWRWVKVRWWRALHLASWALVAIQAATGRACILTIWEDQLTGAEPGTPLIQRWVDATIYWPLPIWAFSAIYLALFSAVILLWWKVPPLGRRGVIL